MKAPAAIGSNGNSRKMKRTLPVSMYFSFSCGNVVSVKWAQCEHVIDAYSMMVTGALSDPIVCSPNGPAFINSACATVCAKDGLNSGVADSAARRAPAWKRQEQSRDGWYARIIPWLEKRRCGWVAC